MRLVGQNFFASPRCTDKTRLADRRLSRCFSAAKKERFVLEGFCGSPAKQAGSARNGHFDSKIMRMHWISRVLFPGDGLSRAWFHLSTGARLQQGLAGERLLSMGCRAGKCLSKQKSTVQEEFVFSLASQPCGRNNKIESINKPLVFPACHLTSSANTSLFCLLQYGRSQSIHEKNISGYR